MRSAWSCWLICCYTLLHPSCGALGQRVLKIPFFVLTQIVSALALTDSHVVHVLLVKLLREVEGGVCRKHVEHASCGLEVHDTGWRYGDGAVPAFTWFADLAGGVRRRHDKKAGRGGRGRCLAPRRRRRGGRAAAAAEAGAPRGGCGRERSPLETRGVPPPRPARRVYRRLPPARRSAGAAAAGVDGAPVPPLHPPPHDAPPTASSPQRVLDQTLSPDCSRMRTFYKAAWRADPNRVWAVRRACWNASSRLSTHQQKTPLP